MNVFITKSFDFVINRFLLKLFRTTSIAIIDDCFFNFDIILPSKLIELRTQSFVNRSNTVEKSFCRLWVK